MSACLIFVPLYPSYWTKTRLLSSKGMRSLPAIAFHCSGAGSPRTCAARVALRSAVAAPAFVKTASSTPLLYSSGPAVSLIE